MGTLALTNVAFTGVGFVAPADKAERYALLTECMGRYVDGDEAAFDVLFRILAPIVRRCHVRWVNDSRADDLTQQTFLKVHQSRARYRRGAPVGPWVLTIARHLSIDELRRQGRSRERLTSEGDLPEMSFEWDTNASSIVEAVREAVADLPAAQRDVVAMHKLEGLTFAEVAESLGIREGAARVRAFRAYDRLRDALRSWS